MWSAVDFILETLMFPHGSLGLAEQLRLRGLLLCLRRGELRLDTKRRSFYHSLPFPRAFQLCVLILLVTRRKSRHLSPSVSALRMGRGYERPIIEHLTVSLEYFIKGLAVM